MTEKPNQKQDWKNTSPAPEPTGMEKPQELGTDDAKAVEPQRLQFTAEPATPDLVNAKPAIR